jgi:signal transduction histidine kinase
MNANLTTATGFGAGGPAWRAADEREFLDEITALNLRHCKVAGIAGVMIALWSSLLSLMMPELRFADLQQWLATCIGIYGVLFVMRFGVVRVATSEAVRRAYVLAFVVALIGICDGFFFVLSHQLTAVSAFSRGMLVTAVLFVLPPRRFIPLVVANELLLCAWLIWRGPSAGTLTAFLDGTAGAVVGAVASWFLYAAKRADFQQQRLIRRQHAEMNELMAITAHDLRSPLLGVKNLLGLAVARTGLERERLLAVMTDAARACDRMLELVTRLVDAHAAEQRPMHANRRVDVRAALVAAAERAQTVADSKQVRVMASVPEHSAEAECDPEALAQMMDNLLGNAVKFSPAGAPVRVALAARDGVWRIEVADEGPGVPEPERLRLFQKYARGTARPTGGEGGNGLGLFIVKTLADRAGARVSHAPRDGGGSVFALELARSPG